MSSMEDEPMTMVSYIGLSASCYSLSMDQAPIFLYTSWRTGGSALAMALKADDNVMLFYDPLNRGLLNFEFVKTTSSDSWISNHPSGFKYFEEYLPLFVDGRIENFPNLSEYKFRNSSQSFQDQLLRYLDGLIVVANEKNRIPVFKFEQLEGHLDLLKTHFPSAIHLGLVRSRQAQLDSWLEQLALGSSGFFDTARELIVGDPDFFTNSKILDNPSDQTVFDIYHSKLLLLNSKFNLTLNLYEDDREEFLAKSISMPFQAIFSSAFRQLDILEKPPTIEKKFIRMTTRAIELTQHRDELTQQHDELTQQHDEILNSTIWKVTKLLRVLINFVKK